MKINSSTIKTNTNKAYCIQNQRQLSLFNEKQLRSMTLPTLRIIKKLYVLIESPDGYSWWQNIERIKGETPWQSCMRYKKETLGKGYWICDYELRT